MSLNECNDEAETERKRRKKLWLLLFAIWVNLCWAWPQYGGQYKCVCVNLWINILSYNSHWLGGCANEWNFITQRKLKCVKCDSIVSMTIHFLHLPLLDAFDAFPLTDGIQHSIVSRIGDGSTFHFFFGIDSLLNRRLIIWGLIWGSIGFVYKYKFSRRRIPSVTKQNELKWTGMIQQKEETK